MSYREEVDIRRYWRKRERHWRYQKIRCRPGCEFNGGWACSPHYYLLYSFQHGACAICGHLWTAPGVRDNRAQVLDHDHKTGEMRGIVCAFPCNIKVIQVFEHFRMLRADKIAGYFEDPPMTLLLKGRGGDNEI